MPRKMVGIPAPEPSPFNKERNEEEARQRDELRRQAEFLKKKAESNALSRDYFNAFKDIINEILMIELAQKAAESHFLHSTRFSNIRVDENSLSAFRRELEKAKLLKLITGILETTGSFNIEEIISLVSNTLYGPKPATSRTDTHKQTAELKKILNEYITTLEKLKK